MTEVETIKQNTEAKRNTAHKPISIITLVLGIVLCMALGVVIVHADVLDDAVLLEDRNPGYLDYLSPEHAQVFYINDANSHNLIISSLESTEVDGFRIVVNPDYSISVDGVNYEKDVHIFYRKVFLPHGDYYYYYYSDGGVNTKGASSFIYSNGDTLASLPWVSTFKADSAHQESGYYAGIVIGKGSEIHETYYPMIVPASLMSDNIEFEPYMTTYGKGESIVTYHNVDFNKINESDVKLMLNSIKSGLVESGNLIDWISLFDSDFNGIQYQNDSINTGKLDQFGRIVS